MLSVSSHGHRTRIGAAVVLFGLAAAGCGRSGSQTPQTVHHSHTIAARRAHPNVLKVGGSETVKFAVPSPLGMLSPTTKLRITVIEITTGGPAPGGFRQYYVRYRITDLGRNLPVGRTQLGFLPDLKTTDGLESSATCLGSDCDESPACPQTLPSRVLKHGKTWTMCGLYILPAPPSGVVYGGDTVSVAETNSSG